MDRSVLLAHSIHLHHPMGPTGHLRGKGHWTGSGQNVQERIVLWAQSEGHIIKHFP